LKLNLSDIAFAFSDIAFAFSNIASFFVTMVVSVLKIREMTPLNACQIFANRGE